MRTSSDIYFIILVQRSMHHYSNSTLHTNKLQRCKTTFFITFYRIYTFSYVYAWSNKKSNDLYHRSCNGFTWLVVKLSMLLLCRHCVLLQYFDIIIMAYVILKLQDISTMLLTNTNSSIIRLYSTI